MKNFKVDQFVGSQVMITALLQTSCNNFKQMEHVYLTNIQAAIE